MKIRFYFMALIAFPLAAMGQAIPLDLPPIAWKEFEQAQKEHKVFQDIQANKVPGVALPVIDASQLAQLVQINYNLEQIKAANAAEANTRLLTQILKTQIQTLEALQAIKANTKQPVAQQ